jgi:phage terminase small subunit
MAMRSTKARAHSRQLWVEAMIANGGNQTQAAITAGHKPGEAARRAGIRYAQDPMVASMLEERRAEVVTKAKLESDEVILSAARQIRFDPRKLVDEKGKVKAWHELDEDTALALSVEAEIEGVKVKVDRGGAQERLMKHLGLFKKDNQQKPAGVVVHKPGVRTVVFVEPLTDTRKG